MNKNYYMNEQSFDALATTVNNAKRTGASFLVKPCYEGKAYPCYESGFEDTLGCPRVIRLEDMRQGIEEHTVEEFFDLKGKQPVFYLQESLSQPSPLAPQPLWCWNGHLLYSVYDANRAREVIAEHQVELNIILSFEDPDSHRYYFLIATCEENLSEENFKKVRSDMDWQLKQYFCHTIHHDLNFYCRALTEDYYDIINRDALFGPKKAESLELREEVKLSVEESQNSKPSSLSLIKSFLGRMFKTA